MSKRILLSSFIAVLLAVTAAAQQIWVGRDRFCLRGTRTLLYGSPHEHAPRAHYPTGGHQQDGHDADCDDPIAVQGARMM